MNRLGKYWLILSTTVTASAVLTPLARADYWQLGAGIYGEPTAGTELDCARWDWMLVCFGSVAADLNTIQRLNRYLEINPRQKYLVRLWPINHLGHPDLYRQTATFLCYLYQPGVQEALERELRRQIRLVLDNLARPENVLGFTFLEELPGWWGAGDQISRAPNPQELPVELKNHQTAIEKERGQPLVWNEETRRWVGQKYVESLARIHRLIKGEAPDKLVFYWQHTNYLTLDEVPPDTPLSTRGLYPYHYADIIRPGLCDGFMAYPNNAEVWEKKYLRFVRQQGWLFFSQLSHPGFMRLQPWEDALEMVKTKLPQNLGYFLYCQGDCNRGQWNDDPSVPPEENLRGLSIPAHLRRIAAQEGVGMDVVNRYFHLGVQMDVPLAQARPGEVIHVVALVQNRKEASYYLDPQQAVATDVQATLSLPPGFRLEGRFSGPARQPLGDLPPQARRAAEWWVTVTEPPQLGPDKAIEVVVTSKNTPPGRAVVREEVAIPGFAVHEVRGSGEQWIEPGYRLPKPMRPVIIMEGRAGPVKNPSLSDGYHTLTYRGELSAGLRLVITPDGRGRLYAVNLVDEPTKGLTDPGDPTGFRAFAAGYGVAGQYLGKYLKGGTKYRVSISGKAEGGANSLVWLRCRQADGKLWERGLLGNAFGEEWKDGVSAEIEIPLGVTLLERFYLYRYHQQGRIWYGPVSIMRADIPPEGCDVSEFLRGLHPVIQPGTFTTITYHDEDPPAASPKVRVQLSADN